MAYLTESLQPQNPHICITSSPTRSLIHGEDALFHAGCDNMSISEFIENSLRDWKGRGNLNFLFQDVV